MDRAKNEKALETLYQIKRRREDRLSRDLSKNNQDILNCDNKILVMHQEQRVVSEEWKAANILPVRAQKNQLERQIEKSYSLFFRKNETILGRIRQQMNEKQALIKNRAELNELLKKNRIEQEKIKYIKDKMK